MECIVIIITIFFLLEITTRIFIKKIPINIIYYFNKEIRSDVLNKVGLISKKDYNEIIRDDNGPPLYIFKPNIEINEKLTDEGASNIKKTDQNGFCNNLEKYNKTSIDIMMLGDSFTWCFAVKPSEAFAHLVEERSDLSSYNLGKGGIGIFEHLQILKKFGLSKNVKYVFLNIYEGNDLRDAIRYYAHKYPSADSLREINDNKKNSNLIKYSYALNLLHGITREIFNKIFEEKEENLKFKKFSLSLTIANKYKNFKYDLLFDNKVVKFNYGNRDLDETNSAIIVNENSSFLKLFNNALINFKHLAKKNNFIPIITYIPSAYTAYNQFVKFEESLLKKEMSDFSNKQRSYLEHTTKNLKMNFIDFTSPFQKHANLNKNEKLLYFPINRHLTTYGHDVVANEMINYLSGK